MKKETNPEVNLQEVYKNYLVLTKKQPIDCDIDDFQSDIVGRNDLLEYLSDGAYMGLKWLKTIQAAIQREIEYLQKGENHEIITKAISRNIRTLSEVSLFFAGIASQKEVINDMCLEYYNLLENINRKNGKELDELERSIKCTTV